MENEKNYIRPGKVMENEILAKSLLHFFSFEINVLLLSKL